LNFLDTTHFLRRDGEVGKLGKAEAERLREFH
jgi:hypothetical protein